jgi:hypothetical protein
VIADGEKPLPHSGFGEYGRAYTGKEVVRNFEQYFLDM